MRRKAEELQAELIQGTYKHQRKAQAPSDEVISCLERATTTAAEKTDRWLASAFRFQTAPSSTFDEVQHTRITDYRDDEDCMRTHAYKTTVTSQFSKRPYPLTGPKTSVSRHPVAHNFPERDQQNVQCPLDTGQGFPHTFGLQMWHEILQQSHESHGGTETPAKNPPRSRGTKGRGATHHTTLIQGLHAEQSHALGKFGRKEAIPGQLERRRDGRQVRQSTQDSATRNILRGPTDNQRSHETRREAKGN